MNKTQCPHCFKVYVISDEQHNAADGMVTCGSCNQEFYASFIDETPGVRLGKDKDGLPIKDRLLAPDYSFDDSLNSEMTISFDDNDTETIIEDDEFEPRPSFAPSQYSLTVPPTEPVVLTRLIDKENTVEADSIEQISEHDINLIEEVDQLISEKILPAPLAAEMAEQIEDISINEVDSTEQDSQDILTEKFKIHKEKRSIFKTFFVTPVLLVLLAVLSVVLLYQLWLRQVIFWPDQTLVQNIIKPAVIPIEQKLKQYDVVLPARRNLNGLQLLAADVEQHVNRASTILLRISLINRAKISQELPTLELTLTDADGRLVSRRSLNPEDYLYNNRTNNEIGINELKKVTIELLAFPKNATGYELRILGETVSKSLN